MSDTFANILKVLPLLALLLVAAIVVFRGLGRKSDDTSNRAKGGGLSNWDHWLGG